MMARSSEEILGRAMGMATHMQHEYFTVEHIFWALLDQSEISEMFRFLKADAIVLRHEVEQHLALNVPRISTDASASSAAGVLSELSQQHQAPVATLGVQRLIQRALFYVQSSGRDEITPLDLFIALFQSKESESFHLLNKYGVHRLDVVGFAHAQTQGGARREALAEGSEASSSDDGSGLWVPRAAPGTQEGSTQGAPRKVSENNQTDFIVDLNQKAREGKIDPLVGRSAELERVIQVLCRRRKNNPLLVGEAGVGKTALAEGLALALVEGKVPELIRDATVFSLDLAGLIAGTKFRGDFESRMKILVQMLKRRPNTILFIDEIHAIVGAGAVAGGSLDGANMLKPLLTQGDLKVMGSTTYKEYRTIFEKDSALARRFQKIDVLEPTTEEAIQILEGLKSKFEDHHSVTYTPESLRASVELSQKHLHDRFLPDKAIDVIDEAGSYLRLRNTNSEANKVVDTPLIEELIAKMARIPTKIVSTSQKERLRTLKDHLKIVIFGQDPAVDQVVSSIRLASSGLRASDRPVGSFLFCGPTGVGKTELCRQLAKVLGLKLLRFDMSEYMEKHMVSRLIGAPPGYVGFEQEGLLTEAVMKNPHSVLLLDEIEKAHPDVWNLLLQVMDHGILTDNNGRKADFRNTLLIMTSNVGAREADRVSLGFIQDGKVSGVTQKAVELTFSPEFRNRLDAIITFSSLDSSTVAAVLDKLLLELESQLLEKSVELEVTASAREWIAQRGYDPKMGARPMARALRDYLKVPLSEELLYGRLENGGHVKVDLKDEKLFFEILSSPPSPQKQVMSYPEAPLMTV